MEPPAATDLDRITDTLRRITTGGSRRSRRHASNSFEKEREHPAAVDNMTTTRRFQNSPREYQAPSSSHGEAVAQWLERNEDAISVHSESSQRDSRASAQSTGNRPFSGRTGSMTSHRKFSNASSIYSAGYSLYPAPSKPLPPLPNSPARPSIRVSSRESSDRSSISTHRSSQASAVTSNPDLSSGQQLSPPPRKAAFFHRPLDFESRIQPKTTTRAAEVVFWKALHSEDKKNGTIHYIDMSSGLSTVASKHGNNIIKIWSAAGGSVQQVIKFSSYTSAQSRSREYLIRSHAIVSEPSNLIAIATRFGRSIEIWDWVKNKSLQRIENADRWAAVQTDSYDDALSSFAVHHGETTMIDLYNATREKKPFVKGRTIDMAKADLPFVPQYPELALSTTSPLLVVAAGPRPPRQGHPPPVRETLLVAWSTDTSGDAPVNKPYRVARPWQHTELDTAIPCDLVTYGSAVVSIWIPATFRAVPAVDGGSGYNLARVPVPYRFVLVWDLAANSTRTFGIPNTTSCISPDCRYVAYCHASGTEIGARGCMVILDVMTGKDVWSWPDPEALAIDSGPKQGFEQFEDLSRVTELHFSADGKFLNVGDIDGEIGMYEVRETTGDRIQLNVI